MTKTIIIDYGSGNLHSAQKAFEKVSSGEVVVSSNPDDLTTATHIVLPGVGAFGDCAAGLRAVPNMIQAMEQEVLGNKKPFLGICVGMQLLAETGYEHGEHKGLGWISGEVVKLEPQNNEVIPHMGWNEINITNPQKITENIDNQDFYFVHSFYFKCSNEYISATVNYCGATTAMVAKDNIFGVQFHPEKSQKSGLKLIENFLRI